MDTGRRRETSELETQDAFGQGSKHHVFHVHISPLPHQVPRSIPGTQVHAAYAGGLHRS